MIALAAQKGWKLFQLDVKSAFLNGVLHEEVYADQPPGFMIKNKEDRVYRLKKALYGLKQAPKQWHQKFDQTMMSHGFKINECDKCVYIKNNKNSCVLVCLYVDDMLIMVTNKDIINFTKKMLCSNFDMKDLGLVDIILGIRVQRTKQGYFLTQSHYAEKILRKFGHFDDPSVVTPFDPSIHLAKNNGDAVSQLEYSQVIRSLYDE